MQGIIKLTTYTQTTYTNDILMVSQLVIPEIVQQEI